MNKPIGMMYTNDSKTDYLFTEPECEIIKPPDPVNPDDIDYLVPRTEEDIKKGHKTDLPMSFFNIKEGDVESGKIWYQNKFPKLSDEFAYLLSRYNWGDLKYATKKSIRNNGKKVKKKTGKKDNIVKGMIINRDPGFVKF